MTTEFKSVICEMDPQQLAFSEAVKKWVSGEMPYEELIKDWYPSYELRPHERIARFVRQKFENLRSPQH
jgi:hypothetical protein